MFRTRHDHLIDSIEIAGGLLKTTGDLEKLLKTDVSGEWGSISTTALPGNGGRDYHADYMDTGIGDVLLWSLNSLGLPNPGMDYVELRAREVVATFEKSGRDLAINVAGDSVKDLVELAVRAARCGFKRITLNGACPNRLGHGLICQDPVATKRVFDDLDHCGDFEDVTVSWKVALGLSRSTLFENVLAVIRSPAVDGLILGNTIGGGTYLKSIATRTQPHEPISAISTSNGLTAGGLAGPVVLGQTLEDTLFATSLLQDHDHKFVVACGGISSAAHVYAAMKLGAVGAQVNTAYCEANEDPRFITGLKGELHDLGI